jgi:hypothetical protein
MTHQQAREEFISLMAQEKHCDFTLHQLRELLTLTQRLHTIGVRQANGHQTTGGDWDEAAAKRDERREERIEQRIAELCKSGNAVPIIGGDPRGTPLILRVPSGRTNSWCQTGIAVPVRE